MNKDFENSAEYKSLLEIAKKQDELIKRVYSNISPETIARFNEIGERINQWRNSISNLPGLQIMVEALKNYEKEVRENEHLSVAEFEEKYKRQITLSQKLGRNGWVISQHSSLASSEQWNELLEEGEEGIQAIFDGDEFPILVIIEEELRKKMLQV